VCLERFKGCARGFVITGAIGVLCLIGALLLVCAMCCCAPGPAAHAATVRAAAACWVVGCLWLEGC
jgi:hypothetical protein